MPAVVELKVIINVLMTCAAVDPGNARLKYTIDHRYVRAVMAGKTRAVIPVRSLNVSCMALRARRYQESSGMTVLAGYIPVTACAHLFPEALLGQFFKS